MANKGVKKKKSNYTDFNRIKNKKRRLEKHLRKHGNNDQVAKKALNSL